MYMNKYLTSFLLRWQYFFSVCRGLLANPLAFRFKVHTVPTSASYHVVRKYIIIKFNSYTLLGTF